MVRPTEQTVNELQFAYINSTNEIQMITELLNTRIECVVTVLAVCVVAGQM